MANKVKFGLKNVYFAAQKTAGTASAYPTFETPVAIPGGVNLTLTPQGDTETFYADNIAYYTSAANNGYSGNLEVAVFPDAFLTTILGESSSGSTGVTIEDATVEPKPFALIFEAGSNTKSNLYVYWNCTATRTTETNATTQATKTPNTETIAITVAPLANGKVRAKTTDTASDSVRSNWFKSVWTPSAS